MDVSFRTILILFHIACVLVFAVAAEEFYYGLCANPTCSVPIGQGIAILKYAPGEHGRIRLEMKQVFDIYVKDYGEKKSLLGIMINGQKGYVPKYVVQEQRSFVKEQELVPATVEFMYVGNQNQGASQIHFSMSHQEVIHHVSPDAYSHEQNYHSNYPSESYGHSQSGWADENSQIYTSPHVHVINSHVEATVTSQTSNIAQQPNTWESTSHIYTTPENSVSSYTSGDQQGTYQNVAPQQQYSQSALTSGNQQQATYQNIPSEKYSESALSSVNQQQATYQNIPPEKYSQSALTSGNQQQAAYQNIPPEKYSQSVYPSEYQSPQFTNELQTSFSSQVQSNLQYAQSSSDKIHVSNTAGNKAQNYAQSPQVEGSHSSYAAGIYSPDGSVSAQYSSHYVKDGESFQYMSSYASAKIKPQIDIPGTIAALKAQGIDESEYMEFFQGETANLDPSHISYSGQEVQGTSYGYSSQSGYSSSGAEMNQNNGLQHTSIPLQTVSTSEEKPDYHTSIPSLTVSSSEEKTDYASSTEHIYSSSQFQQPSDHSESSRQTLPEAVPDNEEEEDDDDTGEVTDNEDENEILDENDSKELPSSVVDEVSDSLLPEKQEDVPSPFTQEKLQSLKQKTVEQTSSYVSESDSVSPSQDTSPETITESKAYTEYHQSTVYPDSSHSNLIKDTMEKIVTSDDTVNDQLFTDNNFKDSSIPASLSSSNLSTNNTIEEKVETIDMEPDDSTFGDFENDNDKNGIFFDNGEETFPPEKINETDTLLDKDQNSDLEKILNISELSEAEQSGYLNAYQIRNLKGEEESKDSQNPETLDDVRNASSPEFDFYEYVENTVGAIRSFIDAVLLWIPEPLYTYLTGLESRGISPRVPVFTGLSAMPCLFLMIAIVYLRERAKEEKLIALLASAEKNVYTLSAEKGVLEEKLEKVEAELESCNTTLTNERKFYDDLKAEVVNLNQELEKSNLEFESRVEEIKALKEQEKEFAKLIADHEKAHLELVEEKNQLNNQLGCQDETICQLNDQLQEKEKEVKELQEEKLKYSKTNEVYEEKLTQLQQNCNQLLKEAEIWNLRVNELNTKLSEETQAKQLLEESLKAKDNEVESLTFLVESFKSFEELEETESDEYKSKKDKLQGLLKSANISIILQRQEDENKLVMQKLAEEKNKILDMEVELLEAKSEIDKLKLSYNQALQDKTEAQTKLEVLTNYFKDKEIQLQKQLGAQEVFRERREKDADSAERRIVLIEQENASYKSQVASMKQEMEETERNLKSQIATHEKKAHENWIAARAAERKLDDIKQEVTQLRQKLTLLERDQGNFINASRDDIIRPIPQRIAGVGDDTINSQDINNSMDEPPGMYRMPLPPMMLPDMRDRPLPPLPLPPPPFEPPPMFAPPPFGPFPRDPMFNSEFRVTPPEFSRGRASTPPRGRQSAINDNDMGPQQSSPLGGELRESRNSTPPHLPDFHDIPPPPRPFYPPHRFPFRPPFRRDFPPGPPRSDYQPESSQSRGTQPSSVPQDSWAPSNSRV